MLSLLREKSLSKFSFSTLICLGEPSIMEYDFCKSMLKSSLASSNKDDKSFGLSIIGVPPPRVKELKFVFSKFIRLLICLECLLTAFIYSLYSSFFTLVMEKRLQYPHFDLQNGTWIYKDISFPINLSLKLEISSFSVK